MSASAWRATPRAAWASLRSTCLHKRGHDAYFVARVAPTAMIFTPCTDGITHNNNERATLERIVPGVNVLVNVVLRRAQR